MTYVQILVSFNRLYATKTPSTRNEAGDSEEIREAVKRFCKFFRDVDVGWERSEPSSKVKYLLPISAVRTHMKLGMMGPRVRFRLTKQST